ncbi:MAG: hypothetical protein ACJATT_000394 [Myxococcota bacterium]
MCATPDEILVPGELDALSCADVDSVVGWVELLASRSIGERQVELLRGDWTYRYTRDPIASRAAITELSTQTTSLTSLLGFQGSEARADAVWAGVAGESQLGDADSTSVDVLERALAPWSTDTENKLILSEMDIEGWIKYASLCREIQGGGPMTVSVANRVVLYQQIISAFEGKSREQQLAVLSMGPVWPSMQERWPGVTYEIQQAWVEAAPLPGPMTATSLGYASAVFDEDLRSHAVALHGAMGRLPLGVAR